MRTIACTGADAGIARRLGTWSQPRPLYLGEIPALPLAKCRSSLVTFGLRSGKVFPMSHAPEPTHEVKAPVTKLEPQSKRLNGTTQRRKGGAKGLKASLKRRKGRSKKRRVHQRRQIDFSTLHPDQNLDEHEVCAFLHISRSNLRNKINPRGPYHDPSFPQPHRMRGQAKEGRSVRWRAGSIIEWNRCQPSCSYGMTSR